MTDEKLITENKELKNEIEKLKKRIEKYKEKEVDLSTQIDLLREGIIH